MTPEPNTSYPSFILYDEQFKKGSAITVKTSSSIRDKDCVARIDKIYTNEECQPFLDITWYYRPEELPTGRQAHHGRDEVLESDLTDTISVDCVNSSAVVHTLEQFQARDSIPLTNTLGNFVPVGLNSIPGTLPLKYVAIHVGVLFAVLLQTQDRQIEGAASALLSVPQAM
eukprot:TRINITY_DN11125_c1_g2_i4.p1 TRINITY_DN11125_c1_g2~~TRINITY_DN11125_c1_g2_i4.p1  ORF type:complete len:171 (+),score=9.30 TRINITY_DN11125_c1_g2_i4:64-576(+)